MGSVPLLVTELQSLASETRRKHPEIREAADKSIAILKANPPSGSLIREPLILQPIFMSLATKNAKIISISLSSLQRLLALKAVPRSTVPEILKMMSDAMYMGVDIQLRILQSLVALITGFKKDVHGQELADALLLCFRLQESKIAVVSSTAAATLRQLVMIVVERMVDEDNESPSESRIPPQDVRLPNGTITPLRPSACDAYLVFQDLCLLANSEKPKFLKLDFLHKTFALELIESVLTNYFVVFRSHDELLLLLTHHLCPLLHKSLTPSASSTPFPLALRCTRVVFLLLKQFLVELKTENEVFLALLIRILDNPDPHGADKWMRILTMEVMRGLCADPALIRSVYTLYDADVSNTGTPSAPILATLLTTIQHLLLEKPLLLGVNPVMSLAEEHPPATKSMLDVVAGVAGAAGSIVGATSGSSAAGLSLESSGMRVQCIDQLDKADPPVIPDTYIYLLALQSLITFADGIHAFISPLYKAIVVPKAGGKAPPPFSFEATDSAEEKNHLRDVSIVRDILQSTFPSFHRSFIALLQTSLSEDLFTESLTATQALINSLGMVGLSSERDVFLCSGPDCIAQLAVPERVLTYLGSSSRDNGSNTPPPSAGLTSSLSLALTTPTLASSPAAPQGVLAEKNAAALRVFLQCSLFLSGTFRQETWGKVFACVWGADFVLTSPTASSPIASPTAVSARRVSGPVPSGKAKEPGLGQMDIGQLLGSIQRLFDATSSLDDAVFSEFVNALCTFGSNDVQVGIKMPSTTRRISMCEFALSKMGSVAKLNVGRVIREEPVGWAPITEHLLGVIKGEEEDGILPTWTRIQAGRVLDDLLMLVPRSLSAALEEENSGSTIELRKGVQKRVFDVLGQQVTHLTISFSTPNASTDDAGTNEVSELKIREEGGVVTELRRMGLETLLQILQGSGHTLLIGWESIFEMLASVCVSSPDFFASIPALAKAQTSLVKIAFQSLTLICDAAVSSLSPARLRLCIATLGKFGKQPDTNIALTAAASLLWSVSDIVMARRKSAASRVSEEVGGVGREEEEEYSRLWMFLLLEVLGLCGDQRPEVRDGAIQTLFRTMQLYGDTLSLDIWEDVIWKVIFPLVEVLSSKISTQLPRSRQDDEAEEKSSDGGWSDSKTLAIISFGSVLNAFLVEKFLRLDDFSKVWTRAVLLMEEAVATDSSVDLAGKRKISTPAFRCLESGAKAALSFMTKTPADINDELKTRIHHLWLEIWEAVDRIGALVLASNQGETLVEVPFCQESLIAIVELVGATRAVSRSESGSEWPLERLKKLMTILKGIMTYSKSKDYRPDVDHLTPLQAGVLQTINAIDLTVHGTPSVILRDLAEYATLPFLAAFDVPDDPASSTPQKRITYIALVKKVMPLIRDLFLQFREDKDLYLDGTVENALSAYSIPIKLKYECPLPSKFTQDEPLWKTATLCFLQIVTECTPQLPRFDTELPDERVEAIWTQVLEVFRGAILADCTPAEQFSLEMQEKEENFDRAVVTALETYVVPYIGAKRVSDVLVSQLSHILAQGTLTRPLPRERFAYWCFDLLFLISSDIMDPNDYAKRRLGVLSIPSLLNRCRSTMMSYIADEAIRGNLPFPRAREDELLYVLRKLMQLRVIPGSVWAALSDAPTQFCMEQPAVDASSTPQTLMADSFKRTNVAHLFHFYHVLCKIASLSGKSPTSWVSKAPPTSGASSPTLVLSDDEGEHDHHREINTRSLARDALRLIGEQMGVPV